MSRNRHAADEAEAHTAADDEGEVMIEDPPTPTTFVQPRQGVAVSQFCTIDVDVSGVPVAAVLGEPYEGLVTASSPAGGPLQFSIHEGAFPPGVTMAAGGLITGTPTEVGDFNVVVAVTDTNAQYNQTTVPTISVAAEAPPPPEEELPPAA